MAYSVICSKLSTALEQVITGKFYSTKVLIESKAFVEPLSKEAISIARFIRGSNTTEDWRVLQMLVIKIADQGY